MAESTFGLLKVLFHQTKPPAGFLKMFLDWPRLEFWVCLGCFKAQGAILVINSHLSPSKKFDRMSAGGLVCWNRSLKSPIVTQPSITSGHSEGACFSCFEARDATLIINSHLGPSQNIVRKSAGGLVWWNRALKSPNIDSDKFHLWSH